jgi:hypothetical protein
VITIIHDPDNERGCIECPVVSGVPRDAVCLALDGRTLNIENSKLVAPKDCPLREAVRHGGGVMVVPPVEMVRGMPVSEYNPRLIGEEAAAARARAPHREGFYQPCCDDERRGMNGGCENCGDPCL